MGINEASLHKLEISAPENPSVYLIKSSNITLSSIFNDLKFSLNSSSLP